VPEQPEIHITSNPVISEKAKCFVFKVFCYMLKMSLSSS